MNATGPFAFLLILYCALSIPLMTACQRSAPITQQQIESFLKSVDEASTRRDPKVLLDHLAKNATITIKMNTPVGPQNAQYTADEYRQRVKDELAALKDYKYQRLETNIEIAPDQKTATITLRLREFLTTRQGIYRVESKQVSHCFAKGKKLLLQSVNYEGALVRIK